MRTCRGRVAALALAAVSSTASGQGVEIALKAGTVDLSLVPRRAPVPGETVAWVAAFAAPLATADRAELDALGVKVLDEIPPLAYLLRGPAEAEAALAGLPGLRAVAPYRPEWKLAPRLAEKTGPTPLRAEVVLFADASTDKALARLAPSGRVVSRRQSLGRPVLLVEAPPSVLASLADLPEVEWLDLAGRGELFNHQVRVVMQTERQHPMANQAFYNPIYGLGLSGAGELVAMGDSGLAAGHEQFLAPGKIARNYVVSPGECGTLGDSYSHGTPVANTLLGDGPRDVIPPASPYGTPDAFDGVAYGASLIMQDLGQEDPRAPQLPPRFCDEEFVLGWNVVSSLLVPAALYGATIHNHSWGHMYFDPQSHQGWGSYTTRAQEIDTWLADPLRREAVVVFAVGNEGGAPGPTALEAVPRTISDEAHAKNVISVGATKNGSGRHLMYDYSSRGPTNDCGNSTVQCDEDGRIKPDLVAPGGSLLTSASSASSDGYCPFTPNCLPWDEFTSENGYFGTSHAAPAISGAAALVREYFRSGLYGADPSHPAVPMPPSSALVKAMLVNSAVMLKDDSAYEATVMVGESNHSYPNYDQGFGRPALDNVLEPAGFRALRVFEDGGTQVFHGGAWIKRANFFDLWQAGCNVLRVTLVWTDPAPALASANVLVNDLDLVVTYKGVAHYGNEGLNGPVPDRLNNVEDVFIPLGANPGALIAPQIQVKGERVTTPGPQPFAVVATYGSCLGNTSCQGPLASGCYAGPGDIIGDPDEYEPDSPCENQQYSLGDCPDCGEQPWPTCEPPPPPPSTKPKPVGL